MKVIVFTLIAFLLFPKILIGSDEFSGTLNPSGLTISEGDFYATHNRADTIIVIDNGCGECDGSEYNSIYDYDGERENVDQWWEEDFKEWLREEGMDKGATMGW
jgi:hypothetical protein